MNPAILSAICDPSPSVLLSSRSLLPQYLPEAYLSLHYGVIVHVSVERHLIWLHTMHLIMCFLDQDDVGHFMYCRAAFVWATSSCICYSAFRSLMLLVNCFIRASFGASKSLYSRKCISRIMCYEALRPVRTLSGDSTSPSLFLPSRSDGARLIIFWMTLTSADH